MEDLAMMSFWKGRRVLLTGHTGFKGSWLTAMLSESGAIIKGISLPAATESHFELIRSSVKLEHTELDIRDAANLRIAIREFHPEVVLHLAAQALVRDSYQDPLLTYETNVMGTANVLNACRDLSSLKAVVVVTSDKCYENLERHQGYAETDRLGGHDPYSNSKACTELVTDAFRRSFFKPAPEASRVGVATARAGNVIGGGDWSRDRLIPDMFRSMRANSVCRIRNPKSTRPWQHVLEPLAGYLMLAQRLVAQPELYSKAFNFGPSVDGATCAVDEILIRARNSLGPSMQWEFDPGPHPHEAGLLHLNVDLAKAELDWNPRWNIDQALSATFEWYKTYLANPRNAADLTFQQIRDYVG